MQTFLPYPDFAECARVLDRQRLGKQRVETLQIAKALITGTGWVNHPATRMWEGHLGWLLDYQRAICREWMSRGYQDTCLEKTGDLIWPHLPVDGSPSGPPPWLGDPALHRSHRANLLRKDPAHYGPLFEADLQPADGYVWPVPTKG